MDKNRGGPSRARYPPGPIGIIIQARMGSSRLPGKVLLDILPGISMLTLVIKRLQNCKRADQVIVATSCNSIDDPISQLAQQLGRSSDPVGVYRGSENDVLSRYYGAAVKFGLRTVVRITSDCPAIDPDVVDQLIHRYLSSQYDYVSNIIERTYPRGIDAEIFSFGALEKAHHEASQALEREHVTAYIYGNPKLFRLGTLKKLVDDHSQYRITVDTPEDLIVARKVLTGIKSCATFFYAPPKKS